MIRKNLKGILLCFVLSLPAFYLGTLFPIVGAPIFAILIGIILAKVFNKNKNLSSGIQFTSKKVLQYAVILLGFGLNLNTVVRVGIESLPIIISTISISLITAYALYKILQVPANSSILIGVGSSICGGSAIAATAPIINAKQQEIAQAISVVFFFNLIAALIFPALGSILNLTNHGFALFSGTAVNDTSSVTATASSWDSMYHTGTKVLDEATIVKLTRTLAIIPITVILGIYQAKKSSKAHKLNIKSAFPMFILYFIIASLFTTMLSYIIDNNYIAVQSAELITSFFALMKFLSKFFIIMAMIAIGLNTDIVKLLKSGGKMLLMGFCCWVAISFVSLAMQYLLGVL